MIKRTQAPSFGAGRTAAAEPAGSGTAPAGTGRPGRRPTMTDVARLAGVSQSSVSLVLNDMPGARISEATRRRVLEAAVQVGYRLNGQRRVPAELSHNGTIAYLVDEISTAPHPVVNLDGARDAAWEQGYLVAAHVTRSNPDLEAATVRAILEDPGVVGVIYSTIFTRRAEPPAALAALPCVLLNCYAEGHRFASVLPGEVTGGHTATAHLVDLGHRRIGLVNGEPWMDASVDRLKGYRQALASADLPFDAGLVRPGDWLPLAGFCMTLDLLSGEDPPTAIFCANDLMASGALDAARFLGLEVPRDLSVIGYDDQELSRYTMPPLTTVVLANYELGRAAVDLLLKARDRRLGRPGRLKIDGDLVLRRTTAPARPEQAAVIADAARRSRERIAAALRDLGPALRRGRRTEPAAESVGALPG